MNSIPEMFSYLANMGTPLIWAGGLHLLIGNIFIGVFEAILLAKFTDCRKIRATGILIIANYVSAWLGYYLIFEMQMGIEITLENLKLWFYLSIVVALLFTVIIEFPFFWYALKKTERNLFKALKVTLLIHCLSYSGLVVWYWLLSETSVMNKLEVVDSTEISLDNDYVLYFRSVDNKHLKKLKLNSKSVTTFEPEEAIYSELLEKISGLEVYNSLKEANQKQIDLDKTNLHDPSRAEVVERDSFSSKNKTLLYDYLTTEEPHWNMGRIASWGETSNWRFTTGYWASEGIICSNDQTGEYINFVQETPIASWRIYNAIHLEDDIVVFQLGSDQICILEVESRKIAKITRGKIPLVIKINMTDVEE